MAKRSGLEAGYDERQVSVLGRAYRYAYLTLLFSLFLYIGSEAVCGRRGWNLHLHLSGRFGGDLHLERCL